MAHYITSKCNGCSVCGIKCPANAIYGQKKEQFHINKKLCMDCSVCGWWCGQGAILDNEKNVVARKKPKEMPKAFVESASCNGCKRCSDICPTHCIEFVDDEYEDNFHNHIALINTKKCVGCGLCESVCEKDAIEVLSVPKPVPA